MKIAIVVGHNAKAPGAYAPTPIGMSEFDFNNLIADEMLRLSTDNLFNLLRGGQKLELFKVNRTFHSSYSAEIDAAYDQVDAKGADASIELHFNAASPSATGTETLSSGSAKSLALAGHLQRAMVKALGRPDRGLKVLGPDDRGGRSLHSARATAVLVEPFFCSNSVDLIAAQRVGITGFAKMYLEGLMEYVGIDKELSPGSTAVNPRNVFGTLKLDTKELTKEEFFSRNHALLAMAVENVNKVQEERAHGEFFVPLSLVDAFCIMNAELGLKGAHVDPKHVHSEKEIGLLPLPANLAYWNGDDSPLDHSRLSPEQNVSEFLLYLSGIKNKPVGRPFAWGEFYADLFRHPSTKGDERAQMHLLAAVVHGWFIPQLYRITPDFGSIAAKAAQAYRDVQPILEELKAAGYKNAIAGDGSIVRNRLENLNSMIAVADPAWAAPELPLVEAPATEEPKPEPVAAPEPEAEPVVAVQEPKPEPVVSAPEPEAEPVVAVEEPKPEAVDATAEPVVSPSEADANTSESVASASEVDPSASEVDTSVAEVDPSASEVDKSASEVDKSASEVDKSAPEAVASAPEVIESAPEVVESASEVVESAPEVIESAPEVVESAPEVIESAPEVVESAPEVVESAPEVVASAPEVVASVAEVDAAESDGSVGSDGSEAPRATEIVG